MNKKEIKIYNSKAKKIDLESGLKKIIGKKVLTKDGSILGKVKEIISKQDKIEGIIVKTKRKIYIDLSYIEDLYSDSVMLKINPVEKLISMQVFDKDGVKIGKVKTVERTSTTNVLKAIYVKKNILSKIRKIPASEIDVDSKNVILNKTYS